MMSNKKQTGTRFELRSTDPQGRKLWALPFTRKEDAEAALLRVLAANHAKNRQHLEVLAR